MYFCGALGTFCTFFGSPKHVQYHINTTLIMWGLKLQISLNSSLATNPFLSPPPHPPMWLFGNCLVLNGQLKSINFPKVLFLVDIKTATSVLLTAACHRCSCIGEREDALLQNFRGTFPSCLQTACIFWLLWGGLSCCGQVPLSSGAKLVHKVQKLSLNVQPQLLALRQEEVQVIHLVRVKGRNLRAASCPDTL